MVRIVSVESDEEAEEVTDWHDQLKELIEGQHLNKVRENSKQCIKVFRHNICFKLTVAVGFVSSLKVR